MRSGFRTVKLKGLWIHPRTGRRYYRTSRGGKERYARLPDDLPLDHPDFIAAWAAAARHQDAPEAFPAGTLGSTWRAALASDRCASFSASYRDILIRQARAICIKAGTVRAAAISERHVRADLRDCPNPNARLKAWRFWSDFCLHAGWITTSPAAAVRHHMKAGDGHPTWTPAEIAAFRARWPIGSVPRGIMELAYWTGARISDLVLIGPQHVGRDGVLAFRQTKTGDQAFVPWSCALPRYARAMAPDRALCHQAVAAAPQGLTFLQTAQGRPRSHKAAGHVLSQACHSIGIARSAHGLRKARAVALAEAGASPSQIGAWTGHRSLSEIAHYTRDMDRRRAVMGVEDEQPSGTMPGLSGTSE